MNHPDADKPRAAAWAGRALWTMIGLILAAWALLVGGLAGQSMWTDEWLTVRAVAHSWAEIIPYLSANERRPPLFWLVFKFWSDLVGTGDLALRIYAVAVTLLLIPVSYRLARRLGGQTAGLLTAALVAFSPFGLLYGRMIRSYMLFSLLALASTWAILRLKQRVTPGRWIAYVLLAAAMVYVDYVALAMLAAHALWLLFVFGRHRNWGQALRQFSAPLAAGAAFLPWVGSLVFQATTSLHNSPADLATGPLGIAVKLVYPFVVFGAGQTLYPWNPFAIAAMLASGLLALGGLWALLRREPAAAWLMLGWIAGSLLFTVLILTTLADDITFLNVPSRAPNIAPAYSLLIALGALKIRSVRWRGVLLGLIGIASVLAIGNYYLGHEFHNPIYAVPVRDVVANVKAASLPGDLIVAEDDTVFGYYYAQAPGPAEYLEASLGGVPPAEQQIAARNPERLWLLVYGRDHSGGALTDPALVTWLQAHYRPLSQQGYGDTSPVYRWVKEKLLHRPAYTYKLTATLYARLP